MSVADALRAMVVTRVITTWATGRRAWRRSLQLRIVAITLLLSSTLVGIFGWAVVGTITNGLFQSKQRNAHDLLLSRADYAVQQLGTISADDPSLPTTAQEVLASLARSQEQPGCAEARHAESSGCVEVALFPRGKGQQVQADAKPHSAAAAWVSPELRKLVGSQHKVAHQLISIQGADGRSHLFYVYGSPVPAPSTTVGYELYYIFPLDDELRAAALVRNTVIGTGLALVLLLAALSALVTGLVVKPVRLAARTAQRLSAGLLDQRMTVRGEDDLAQLAASFNQMAANLQRQIVRLEEMSRQQRRFTSDVSHELRTPLTTVRMAADLIYAEREDFDPAVARSAELLSEELDRFENLLTDLLEISRFDAGFAVLDAEPADLVAIVRRIADRLGAVAARAGVPVELDLPDEPVIAEVDPRRMERMLRNLIGNAIEHGESHPVRVTLRCDDTAAAVTVRDHGIGLNPGEEKLVFNRFWRADPSRARQTGGTGLGLSISLEDARLHGGWLEAWGMPAEGAQFRLTVPLRAGARLVASPLRLVPDDVRVSAEHGLPGSGREPGQSAAHDGTGAVAPDPGAAEPDARVSLVSQAAAGSVLFVPFVPTQRSGDE